MGNKLNRVKKKSSLTEDSDKMVVALYDYKAKGMGDLSFRKKDKLIVLDESDNDWWHARHLSSKQVGYIPRIYVTAKETTPNEDDNNDIATVKDSSNGKKGATAGRKVVVALYDYTARDSGDLSFFKGDRLSILSDSDNDWWQARHIQSKKKGLIPRNFVATEEALEIEDWFFGQMSFKDAEKTLLQPHNQAGTYLIRNSEQTPGAFALSVKNLDPQRGYHVKHYKIRCLDNGGYFVIPKIKFGSLQDLVIFYADAANGLCCRLTSPCLKPRPHMWDLSSETRDQWEISHDEITIERKLGTGNFGEVSFGKWRASIDVAVKTIKATGQLMSKDAFLKEASIMKILRHEKLVSLYAVCTVREPFYIVTEYMCNGSLLDYLRTGDGQYLQLPQLVDIAAQIASGMKYLEANQLVHRDLAARNILVGENNIVKVADFGLARIMENSIYQVKQGISLPVKWTALEAILKNEFTTKSDVWSFGILLIELVTHGQMPYAGIPNHQVIELLKRKYRPPHPVDCDCPDDLYRTMLECWDSDPNKRPTFEHLFTYFDDFIVSSDHKYHDANDLPPK